MGTPSALGHLCYGDIKSQGDLNFGGFGVMEVPKRWGQQAMGRPELRGHPSHGDT